MDLHGKLTVPPQWDEEGIVCSGGEREVGTETTLSRIVVVPVIIEETEVGSYHDTTLQVQSGQRRVMIVPAGIVGKTSAPVLGCFSRIPRRGEHPMKGALKGDVTVGKTSHPLALEQNTCLDSCISHRREVGVELVAPAKAQQQGSCHRTSVRHSLHLRLLGIGADGCRKRKDGCKDYYPESS